MKALLDLETEWICPILTVESNFLDAVENTVFLGLKVEKPLSLSNYFNLLISVIRFEYPSKGPLMIIL